MRAANCCASPPALDAEEAAMKVEAPARHELDPIEIASRDEIAALKR